MIIYLTGESYDEFKMNGAEGPMFDLVNVGHGQIMIYKRMVPDSLVESFSQISRIEFGLKYYRNQILLTFKTDQTKCVDMVYAPQRTHIVSMDELRDYPDPEGGLSVNLLLIDSMSGTVKNMHIFGTDIKFHKAFASAVRDKMNSTYSLTEDEDILRSIYQMYPTSNALAKHVDVMFKHQD